LIDPLFLVGLGLAMLLCIGAVIGYYSVYRPWQRRRLEREHHRNKRR
jgi:hypothetical protein